MHAVGQFKLMYDFISIGPQIEGLFIRCFSLDILSIDASFDLAGQGPSNKDPAQMEQVEYGLTMTTSYLASDQFHGSAVPRVLVHRGFDATVLYVSLGPFDRSLTDAPSSTYCSHPVRDFSGRSLLRRTIRVRGLDPQSSKLTLRPLDLMPSDHYPTATVSICFFLMGSRDASLAGMQLCIPLASCITHSPSRPTSQLATD